MPPDAVVCHRVDRTTLVLRWTRRLGMVVLGAALALMAGNVAHAFWTAGGDGLGLAATGTISPPTNVGVSSPLGSDSVAVSWNPASVSDGGSVWGYYVSRMPAEGGLASPACGTSPTELTPVLSCTDAGVGDGSYRYVVTGVLGSWTSESDPSAAVSVRFNTSYPSVVATTSPAPNANGYNRTSPVTLQLSANDSDGVASITYQVNGAAPVTVSSANASITLSGDGTYTITYSAKDTLGGASPTATRVVRIDRVAPAAPSAPTLTAASDTGVSSTDLLTNDQTPTFTGTAEPGSTVRLYNGATLLGSAVASVSGTYAVTSGTLLPEGVRTVTATATDPAENTSVASSGSSITVDITGPSVTPATPALEGTSDTGRSSTDRITADNTPGIFGSARNSGADVLHLYVGGVELGSAPATPTATITATSLGDGTHSITMRGGDKAGNLSAHSVALPVTIDTLAPQAPSAPTLTAGSDTGVSSSDGVTNDSTPTVTGTNEAAAHVTLFAGATEVGSQTTAATSYSVTSTGLSNGSHMLTATATDVAGNVGPASASTTITIDTTAPTAPSAPVLAAASDSGLHSDDRVTNVTTPTFSGTAPTGADIRLYDNGAATGASKSVTDGTWTVATGTLSDGAHTITARTAPDLAGNVGISSPTTVTIDTVAPATPVAPSLVAASDSGRSSSDQITNDQTPTFFDPVPPGVAGVQLYDGGVQVGSATASPSYMVTSSALADGTHAMTQRLFDLAGNISPSSAARQVTIDTVAPAAPSAPVLAAGSDSGSSATDRVTNVAAPTVTGTNEGSAIVTLFDGATQVGAQTTTSTSYSITSSTLSDGGHTLRVSATDVAGNVGPTSPGTTVTIDTVAPPAPSAPALTAASDSGVSSNDGITKVTTPTFTGTAPAGSNVRLFDSGTATGQVVVAGGGAYTATAGSLGNGSRTITARTDPDLAGNVGVSPATTVTVDTVAPTVSISTESTSPPGFRLTFDETVHNLTSSDLALSGSANPTTITVTGSGLSYVAQVSGMDRTGNIVVTLGADQVTDTAGNSNVSSSSGSMSYTDTVAPAIAITKFVPAGSQTALVEGTVGTGPGDPSTVTVVLCTAKAGNCSPGDTVATLTATADTSTGSWSVTSGNLGAINDLFARAHATDLSGNTRLSAPAGPVSIPAAASAAGAARGEVSTGTGSATGASESRLGARSEGRRGRRLARRALRSQ